MSARRIVVATVALALACAALLAALTGLALESGEVIVLRTGDPSAPRETRVWVAPDGDALLVEAATPERRWYRDLLARPELEVVRDGAAASYRAFPEPGPEGRARIRALLRARYGWADAFVGLLQDTSRGVLVRLEPQR